MITLNNFVEKYPEKEIVFDVLEVSPQVEHSGQDNGWGSALSLSIEETLEYCRSKPHSFVPSSGLLFSVFKQFSLEERADSEKQQFLQEINDYWHRTSSLLVFPIADKPGYVVHYVNLEKGILVREKTGDLAGKIKIEISKEEFPPCGEIARIEKYPVFFQKILGSNCVDINSPEICMWIPPEKLIRTAPEKLIIFGAIAQYGMGLWLTSHTTDKALSGTRPFRLAYDIPKI